MSNASPWLHRKPLQQLGEQHPLLIRQSASTLSPTPWQPFSNQDCLHPHDTENKIYCSLLSPSSCHSNQSDIGCIGEPLAHPGYTSIRVHAAKKCETSHPINTCLTKDDKTPLNLTSSLPKYVYDSKTAENEILLFSPLSHRRPQNESGKETPKNYPIVQDEVNVDDITLKSVDFPWPLLDSDTSSLLNFRDVLPISYLQKGSPSVTKETIDCHSDRNTHQKFFINGHSSSVTPVYPNSNDEHSTTERLELKCTDPQHNSILEKLQKIQKREEKFVIELDRIKDELAIQYMLYKCACITIQDLEDEIKEYQALESVRRQQSQNQLRIWQELSTVEGDKVCQQADHSKLDKQNSAYRLLPSTYSKETIEIELEFDD